MWAWVSGVAPVWPLILCRKWRVGFLYGWRTVAEEQREVAEMVIVQGRRNYHRWREEEEKEIARVKSDRDEEREREREREKRRQKGGGEGEGLGDCVRERGRAEWRVQTRSGHGTSCCARSIERSYHLCYTLYYLWRINSYIHTCVYMYVASEMWNLGRSCFDQLKLRNFEPFNLFQHTLRNISVFCLIPSYV